MKKYITLKTRILTAAVLCACTTLWVNTAWAQVISNNVLYGGNGYNLGTTQDSSNNKDAIMNNTTNNGSVKGVYGGFSFELTGWGDDVELAGQNKANSNVITVNGGEITGGKYTITVSPIGGWPSTLEFNGVVAGGYSNYTSNNVVVVNNGDIKTSVYGGYSMVSGNENKSHPEIIGNKVNINGGTITGGNIAGAYVTSNRDNGNNNIIKENTVTINGGNITTDDSGDYGNIYGAFSEDRYSILNGNKVIINDGTIKTADSSVGGIYGAYASNRYNSAIGNIVEINGGTIEGDIYGAFAHTWYSYSEDSGEVRENKVIIKGGKIIGNVYAGESQQGTNLYNNSIEIFGNSADLSQANLYGWRSNDLEEDCGIVLYADSFEGIVANIQAFNDVNIVNNSNIKVSSINLNNDYYYNGDLNLQNSSLTANTVTGITKIDVKNSELITDKLDHFDYLEIDNNNQKTLI